MFSVFVCLFVFAIISLFFSDIFFYFKMNLHNYIILSVLLMISEGFQVKGPSGPLVVPLGGSVVLNCSVDKALLMEGLEVEWRRTDSETLVHLFQDGMSKPEARHQDYHDRAHFFTEEIRHGNVSLLLNSVRAEDEGEYRCKVHSDQDSDETLVTIKSERLIVSGSNHSISAYAGEDITLSCSVDSHIPPEEIEEVSWKKIDKDELILVLLYQKHESEANSPHERYRDRAEFFTDEIPKGNFSIRLKNVRTEDKGVYMCHVFARGLSVNATVVLEQLGFSTLHIMVLILCITASGSTLLLCCLIYCRSQDKDNTARKHVRTLGCLQICLPNIILFFAFILWGIIEGSLNETISCCCLCILRPLMLIWTAPYLEDFPDIFRRWIKASFLHIDLAVFVIVYNSAFFRQKWERIVLLEESDRVGIIILFGILVLICVLYIIRQLTKLGEQRMPWHGEIIKWICAKLEYVAAMCIYFMIWFQFILLIFAFGLTSGVKPKLVDAAVLPGIFFLSFSCLNGIRRREKSGLHLVDNIVWIIFMFLMDVVLVNFYMMSLTNETDRAGWTCTALFLQTLWMFVYYMELSSDLGKLFFLDCTISSSQDGVTENESSHSPDDMTEDFSNSFPVYLIGAVGLVLLNSVVLMTELILTTINGERAVGDLRIIIFLSECFFVLSVLILHIFSPWIPIRTDSQMGSQTAAGAHEMKPLSAPDSSIPQT